MMVAILMDVLIIFECMFTIGKKLKRFPTIRNLALKREGLKLAFFMIHASFLFAE